jgi:hypothetical protein
VLEDRIMTREAARRRKRPFAQEVAEMMRYAVGYRSRAFVTFGEPIPIGDLDPDSRRGLVTLAHRVQKAVGGLHKVLPTALVAVSMRPSIARTELADRVGRLIETLAAAGANLAVTSAREAVDDGVDRLASRDILVDAPPLVRVRERTVLRYYARSIQHLVAPRRPSAV